jgi:hypothetical protein
MFLMLLALTIDPPAPPASAAVQKPKMVCRGGEEALGSHMRTGLVCKTVEQWRREDEDVGRAHPPETLRVTPAQGDALTRQPPP